MKNLIQLIITTTLVALLAGCGAAPYSGQTSYYQPRQVIPLSQSDLDIRAALQEQYLAWQGTPYRLGGDSRTGIDCSAFTQVTYRQQFDRFLPRTTAAQAVEGVEIDTQVMAPGDLLFFNTDVKVRHVGIYMGQGEFLHASTSKGVTVSRLSNPYWRNHFWQARRIN